MMKKRKFGSGGMPSIRESAESAERGKKLTDAEGLRMGVGQKPKKKPMPATRSTLPSMKAIVAAGNRASKKDYEDAEAVKKYAKGGKVKPVDIDMKGLEEASRSKASFDTSGLGAKAAEARNLNAVRAKEASDTAKKESPAAPKKQSFSAAFAAARKRGDKTFSWNGGSYGTKMKGEDDKPVKANKPSTPTPTPTPTPTAARAGSASKPGNASSPMSSVIRNLDSGYDRGAHAKKLMAESNNSLFTRPISMKEALEKTREDAENIISRSAARAERERQAKSLKAGRRANPNLVDQFIDMTTNPGVDQKYAKGGSVSKRGDGCAVRGKTKGKIC